MEIEFTSSPLDGTKIPLTPEEERASLWVMQRGIRYEMLTGDYPSPETLEKWIKEEMDR